MSDSTPSSFAEKARAMLAREDAVQAKQVTQQETAERRRERLAAEGPAIYQQLTAELVQEVKSQVQQVGRIFSIPAHSQKNAELEVVVRDKWLLTVRLSSLEIELDVYNLVAQNNPRMREQSDSQDHSRYRLELDSIEQWQWHYDGGSSPTHRSSMFTPGTHAPGNLTNQGMIAHILDKALGLAEEEKPFKPGAFIIP